VQIVPIDKHDAPLPANRWLEKVYWQVSGFLPPPQTGTMDKKQTDTVT